LSFALVRWCSLSFVVLRRTQAVRQRVDPFVTPIDRKSRSVTSPS